jgi:hypothetical protein
MAAPTCDLAVAGPLTGLFTGPALGSLLQRTTLLTAIRYEA